MANCGPPSPPAGAGCPSGQACSGNGQSGGSSPANNAVTPPVPKPADPILKYDQCATQVRNEAEHNSKIITFVSGVSLSNVVAGCAFTGPLMLECEGSVLAVESLNEGVNQAIKYSSIWDGETACMGK